MVEHPTPEDYANKAEREAAYRAEQEAEVCQIEGPFVTTVADLVERISVLLANGAITGSSRIQAPDLYGACNRAEMGVRVSAWKEDCQDDLSPTFLSITGRFA